MSATIACQPLRLNYFLRIPNVGDRINPAVVTGQPDVLRRFRDLSLSSSKIPSAVQADHDPHRRLASKFAARTVGVDHSRLQLAKTCQKLRNAS
jgi:hypothetical protein